jgi:predicted type IV restriction endonuclease
MVFRVGGKEIVMTPQETKRLFKALGWDVDDTNEVTLEENVSNKRVDYAFKLNGVSQFYLEAKPLKADLTDPDYIKQAITYAYGKGVTWVVLTDFEELRLFNAQTGKGWRRASARKDTFENSPCYLER